MVPVWIKSPFFIRSDLQLFLKVALSAWNKTSFNKSFQTNTLVNHLLKLSSHIDRKNIFCILGFQLFIIYLVFIDNVIDRFTSQHDSTWNQAEQKWQYFSHFDCHCNYNLVNPVTSGIYLIQFQLTSQFVLQPVLSSQISLCCVQLDCRRLWFCYNCSDILFSNFKFYPLCILNCYRTNHFNK